MSENQVSVTVTIPENDRDWLVRLAEVTGHTRVHPTTGEWGGNLSWSVNEAIRFLRKNNQKYIREETNRLANELGGE